MAQKTYGVGMIGCGTVGTGVARILKEQGELLQQRVGRRLELRRVLVRDAGRGRDASVPADIITDDVERFFGTGEMPVIIEVAGGRDPVSGWVRRALTDGRHVVTANKSLLAAEGPELSGLARKHGAAIAFEASCGGGIPIVTAMQCGLMANRIDALYGILNGTCNYILTEMTREGKSYAQSLQEAKEAGFAEADPTMDVSGQDTAEKLAVMASLAFGVSATTDQVWFEGIDGIDVDDLRFGAELGYDIKLLAIAERTDPPGSTLSLRVHPSFVRADAPLAQVHGSFNALSVFGHATGHTMYVGRGAGQMPTASAVVSDLMNIAAGWYPRAFADLNLWCNDHEPPHRIPGEQLTTRFYMRISALDGPGVMAKVGTILGDKGISASALLQHEMKAGQFVPVVIVTHEASQGAMSDALDEIEKLDVVDGRPVCIRIIDLPEG